MHSCAGGSYKRPCRLASLSEAGLLATVLTHVPTAVLAGRASDGHRLRALVTPATVSTPPVVGPSSPSSTPLPRAFAAHGGSAHVDDDSRSRRRLLMQEEVPRAGMREPRCRLPQPSQPHSLSRLGRRVDAPTRRLPAIPPSPPDVVAARRSATAVGQYCRPPPTCRTRPHQLAHCTRCPCRRSDRTCRSSAG